MPQMIGCVLRSCVTAAALSLWAVCGFAQNLVVRVEVPPPYSPDLNIWTNNPNKVLIYVINPNPSQGYDFRFSGSAKNQTGSVAMETKDDIPVRSLHINAGETRQFNLNDFRIFDAGVVKFTGTDASTIARTKLLPDGVYTLCIKAIDYKTRATISNEDCKNFNILTVDPPRFLQPSCGARVTATDPQSLAITWSYEPGTPGAVQYNLQMLELLEGQNINDAFRTRRGTPFFERMGLRGTTLLYGPAEPRLRLGQRYGIRIQAIDPTNAAYFKNEGYGAACEFVYGESVVSPPHLDTTPIVSVKKEIVTDGLGIGCITMAPYATETSGKYSFFVRIEPEINIDAINGGQLELYRTKGSRMVQKVIVRGWDPKSKAHDRSFKGHGSNDLRMLRSSAGETHLELLFADGFTPEKNADYEWRFILNFDGAKIRKDGSKCITDVAYSEWHTIPDLIIKKKLPDTLICGTFTIVVEDYDNTYQSIDPTLPSGTGCIKFDCKKKFKLPIWGDLHLVPKYLDVVSTPKVSNASSQIQLADALAIDAGAYAGGKILAELPVRDNADLVVADIGKYIDFYKKNIPDCFRVRFRDIKWSGPVEKTVTLTEGYAWYPADPVNPAPPAMLTLDSGFTLAIDSLILTPAEATVQGKVLLPKNVISADTCTRAFVYLPKTTITSNCEFYKEVPDSNYGRWWVGNTGFKIYGHGYVVDFSSSQSYGGVAPPLGASWKGIVLIDGRQDEYAGVGDLISNRGWTQARYNYSHAFVKSNGFEGTLLQSAGAFSFKTLEPFGYLIHALNGKVNFSGSAVTGGEFRDGDMLLPTLSIRRIGGGQITIKYDTLTIQPDEDLFGRINTSHNFEWGEFDKTTGDPRYYTLQPDAASPTQGYFYLAARFMEPYYPADSIWHQPTFASAQTQLEFQRIQGATLVPINRPEFIVYTIDVPGAAPKRFKFEKEVVYAAWLNPIRTGPHGEVYIIKDSARFEIRDLGDNGAPTYQGVTPFKINFGVGEGTTSVPSYTPTTATHLPDQRKKTMVRFQFVESAVWDSELSGDIKLEMPMGVRVAFKKMMFTSTADCAGGQLDLSKPDSLAYWGVDLVAKDTSQSAGVVCARLGVIYLTAAGLAEPKHYSQPFWLTWGEIKANGNWGRLFFDYNSVGQRFDGFAFTPSLVKLSDYSSSVSDSAMDGAMNVGYLYGYLHAAGTIQFPFFGAKYMSLSDYLIGNSGYPYQSRYIRLRQGAHLGAGPSETSWERNWAGGVANFVFTTITYDSAMQFGFLGSGTSALNAIGGTLDARITIHPDRSCFSLMYEGQRGINLAVVANFSMMEKIWGCGCIVGGTLERIVVGAEISTGGGVGASILARAGSLLAIKMSFTPSQHKVQLHGNMYVVIASAVNADVLGFAEFVADWSAGYVEGYLKGELTLSGPIFTGGIKATGELQWHFGIDYNGIQGRVAVGIYSPVSMGMEAGIFVGVNFPKSKIWVTDGINGRFGFNKGALPTNVTGTYAFISFSQSVNLYIVSGGYQVYIGTGAFIGYGTSWPGSLGFGVIGTVGVRIWGEILGGLVSASAWGQLSMVAGVPPAFEGAIGLEACVLWVFCGSVTVHCGYNQTDGFYVY